MSERAKQLVKQASGKEIITIDQQTIINDIQASKRLSSRGEKNKRKKKIKYNDAEPIDEIENTNLEELEKVLKLMSTNEQLKNEIANKSPKHRRISFLSQDEILSDIRSYSQSKARENKIDDGNSIILSTPINNEINKTTDLSYSPYKERSGIGRKNLEYLEREIPYSRNKFLDISRQESIIPENPKKNLFDEINSKDQFEEQVSLYSSIPIIPHDVENDIPTMISGILGDRNILNDFKRITEDTRNEILEERDFREGGNSEYITDRSDILVYEQRDEMMDRSESRIDDIYYYMNIIFLYLIVLICIISISAVVQFSIYSKTAVIKILY